MRRTTRSTRAGIALSVCLAVAASCSPSGRSSEGAKPAASAHPTTSPSDGSTLSIADGPFSLRVTHTTRVADGVFLHEIVEPAGPNQIRLLEVDTSAAGLDLVAAGTRYPQLAPVSAMVRSSGAVAGVNGEFYTVPGRPEFLFMADGELWQTGLHAANTVAVTSGHEPVDVRSVDVRISVAPVSGGRTVTIRDWNTYPPRGSSIAGFTTRGGTVAMPPTSACAVRLDRPSPPSWADGRRAITRTYTVTDTGCGRVRRPSGSEVVLTAARSGAGRRQLESLRRGTHVALVVSTGVPGVVDIAGGQPVLVKDGKNVVRGRCTTSFCSPQPRTGIGLRSDGVALVMTVDGLRRGWSVGMTPARWADLFVQVGAADAINLDGGASTQMVVRGLGLVDRPSTPNGKERHVGTALVVLDGGEASIPAPLRPQG